jgi:hypothetical protein
MRAGQTAGAGVTLSRHDFKATRQTRSEGCGLLGTRGCPAWDNTIVDILAYASREEANKNWDAMMADPEFQEVIKSEQANKLVEKIDSTYMRPTDFSPMK